MFFILYSHYKCEGASKQSPDLKNYTTPGPRPQTQYVWSMLRCRKGLHVFLRNLLIFHFCFQSSKLWVGDKEIPLTLQLLHTKWGVNNSWKKIIARGVCQLTTMDADLIVLFKMKNFFLFHLSLPVRKFAQNGPINSWQYYLCR